MQQLVKKYACWHSSAGCTLFRLATQLFAVALSDGLAPATSRSAVVRESQSRSTGAHTDTGEWPSVPTCEEMLSMCPAGGLTSVLDKLVLVNENSGPRVQSWSSSFVSVVWSVFFVFSLCMLISMPVSIMHNDVQVCWQLTEQQ